jgi:hypothetical protein
VVLFSWKGSSVGCEIVVDVVAEVSAGNCSHELFFLVERGGGGGGGGGGVRQSLTIWCVCERGREGGWGLIIRKSICLG